MRIVAYINPEDDAEAVHARLSALADVDLVACRNGRYWEGQPEAGFDRCWAADYPAIRAAYVAAGVETIEGLASDAVWSPTELQAIDPAPVVTVLCHGKHAKRELAQHPPIGLLIAINNSGVLLPDRTPDVLLANDGFIGDVRRMPCRIAAVRGMHRGTLPSVPWYDLSRVGITQGLWSVCCALLLAERALGVRHLRLIGHDCLPGVGSVPGASWGSGHIEACRRDTDVHLKRLAAAGVVIEHIRSDGRKVWVDDYQPKGTARE